MNSQLSDYTKEKHFSLLNEIYNSPLDNIKILFIENHTYAEALMSLFSGSLHDRSEISSSLGNIVACWQR